MTPLTQNHQHEVEADIAQAIPIVAGLLASGDFTLGTSDGTKPMSVSRARDSGISYDAVEEAINILEALRIASERSLRERHNYDA